MPAKAPIYLKAVAPRRGKKQRLRDVLSGDMISPPLGDVRHSAHVGPEGEGDMFGDVRFLQGKMDMLPSPTHPPAPQNGHARSHSVQQRLDEEGGQGRDPQGYAAYNGLRYCHTPAGMLKTTISLPGFLAHEQAPPKPPRLHLDDPSPPFVPTPSQRSFFVPQLPTTTQPGDGQKPGGPLSLVENGGVGRLASEPYRDVSLSPDARLYVHPPPSSSSGSGTSSSSSEASSEDSASEGCGLLEPRKGLSLDSDAGLSNEDLRSERSESPWARCPAATAPTSSSTSALASSSSPTNTGVPRSDSMAVLDLDLGPSILDDVLGIMDRYKTLDNRWEL